MNAKDFYKKEIIKANDFILSQYRKNDFLNNNSNARFQEGVLTLAWIQKRFGIDSTEEIEKALDHWLKLQNKDGSFPENSPQSFSATSFSSLAVAETMLLFGNEISAAMEERIVNALKKATYFIEKNRVLSRTNQTAVAAVTLTKCSELFPISQKSIEDKISETFSNKTHSGFFLEDDGVDLGYSSLTWEMLSMIGFTKDSLEFIDSVSHLMFPDGTIAANFSRTNGWFVLDFFERAAKESGEAKRIAEKHIEAHLKGLCNATHFIDDRHVFTDSYRLCWAFDNCSKRKSKKIKSETEIYLKKFPEKIIVNRKKDYMAIFYLANKFSQDIWVKTGVSTNLASNIDGATNILNKFVMENPESMNYKFNSQKLIVEGCCKHNFSNTAVWGKIYGKIMFNLKKPCFKKEFIFNNKDIKVRIDCNYAGTENIPVIGNIKKPEGFIEKPCEKKENCGSVFNLKKDFRKYSKKFSEKIEYELIT